MGNKVKIFEGTDAGLLQQSVNEWTGAKKGLTILGISVTTFGNGLVLALSYDVTEDIDLAAVAEGVEQTIAN